jgi:hypothetical protein
MIGEDPVILAGGGVKRMGLHISPWEYGFLLSLRFNLVDNPGVSIKIL